MLLLFDLFEVSKQVFLVLIHLCQPVVVSLNLLKHFEDRFLEGVIAHDIRNIFLYL